MAKNDNIRIYRLAEPFGETCGGCWRTPYVANTENDIFENPALIDGPAGENFLTTVKTHGYKHTTELISPKTPVAIIPRNGTPKNALERKVEIAIEIPRIVYQEMLGMYNKEQEYHTQERNGAEQQYLRSVARLAEQFVIDRAALEKTRDDKKHEHFSIEISDHVEKLLKEEMARRAHSTK